MSVTTCLCVCFVSPCMCVCISWLLFVCLFLCRYMCLHVFINVCMFVCVCKSSSVCMCVFRVRLCVSLFIYVHMSVFCPWVSLYVSLCLCVCLVLQCKFDLCPCLCIIVCTVMSKWMLLDAIFVFVCVYRLHTVLPFELHVLPFEEIRCYKTRLQRSRCKAQFMFLTNFMSCWPLLLSSRWYQWLLPLTNTFAG